MKYKALHKDITFSLQIMISPAWWNEPEMSQPEKNPQNQQGLAVTQLQDKVLKGLWESRNNELPYCVSSRKLQLWFLQ